MSHTCKECGAECENLTHALEEAKRHLAQAVSGVVDLEEKVRERDETIELLRSEKALFQMYHEKAVEVAKHEAYQSFGQEIRDKDDLIENLNGRIIELLQEVHKAAEVMKARREKATAMHRRAQKAESLAHRHERKANVGRYYVEHLKARLAESVKQRAAAERKREEAEIRAAKLAGTLHPQGTGSPKPGMRLSVHPRGTESTKVNGVELTPGESVQLAATHDGWFRMPSNETMVLVSKCVTALLKDMTVELHHIDTVEEMVRFAFFRDLNTDKTLHACKRAAKELLQLEPFDPRADLEALDLRWRESGAARLPITRDILIRRCVTRLPGDPGQALELYQTIGKIALNWKDIVKEDTPLGQVPVSTVEKARKHFLEIFPEMAPFIDHLYEKKKEQES